MAKKLLSVYVILVLLTFVLSSEVVDVDSDSDVVDGVDGVDGVDKDRDGVDVVSDVDQSILYSTPNIDNYYIYEHFDDSEDFSQRWIRSEASKSDSQEFQYSGEWALTPTTPALKRIVNYIIY